MRNKIIWGKYILLMVAILPLQLMGQRHEIYHERIASLQVVAGDDWLSPPVTTLHGEPIYISFDDLTHEYHRYVYRIEHCDANWQPTQGLFTSDYIDGFTEGLTIDDYTESINTNVLYTHYSLSIPNDLCRLKLSGNYRVTVYDENEEDEPMFTACFMVSEDAMTLGLSATTNTDMGNNSYYQQVGMTLNYDDLRVTNHKTQIKTVVVQNGRWDNAIINPTPQYVIGEGLRWDHCRDLIFQGGNEYRKFEILDVSHTTMGLDMMDWDGTDFHAYVFTDEPRPSYVYDESANGSFYIRNSDNVDNDYISEYVLVHFTLKSEPNNENIYLNGDWTLDRFLPSYRMIYDPTDGLYHAVVRLKQGYYSYQYLILRPDGTTTILPSEGNFYQTENQYHAYIYYKGVGERADRLVAYQQIQLCQPSQR